MEPTGPAQQASPPRVHGLDAARAGAVVAMVFGHCAEALLSLSVRATPAVQTYWIFRGLTAPLFLFVSGWAVVTAISRSGATGAAVFRARVPRGLLLIGLGLLLRWPGWGLDRLFGFDPGVWAHFLGFDALHCIGLALLLCAGALAFVHGRRARVAVTLALAVLLPALGALTFGRPFFQALPQPLHAMLVTSVTSPFPLLPWGGYFFAGATCGLLLPLLRSPSRRGFALLAAGAALVAVMHPFWAHTLPIQDPVQFLHRLGQVLVLCAAAAAIPAGLSRRLQPVGRSTLVIYVLHLPIVYGWSTFPGLGKRWGRVLELWQIALVAAALVGAGLLLAWGLRRGRAALGDRLVRPAASDVDAPPP